MASKWARVKEEATKRILDAAICEFADNGYTNTHLLDIAKRAGVSQALVSKYFETKENLFCEVVENMMITHLFADHSMETLYKVFDRMLNTLKRLYETDYERFHFYQMFVSSTDTPQRSLEILKQHFWNSSIPQLTEEEKRRGGLPNGDVWDIQYFFFESTVTLIYKYHLIGLEIPDNDTFMRYVGFYSEEIREKENQKNQGNVLRGLVGDFDTIFLVDLEDHSYRILQKNDLSFFGGLRYEREHDFFKGVMLVIDRRVFPEDRILLAEGLKKETILQELEKNDAYFLDYRVLSEHIVRYYQIKVTKAAGAGSHGSILVAIHNIDSVHSDRIGPDARLEATLAERGRLSEQLSSQNALERVLTELANLRTDLKNVRIELENVRKELKNTRTEPAAAPAEQDLR